MRAARSRISERVLTKTSSPKFSVPQLSVAISGLQSSGCARLLDAHADRAARGGLDNHVRLVADAADRLREERARLRGRAVGVADVEVDHARPRVAAARGLVGDLLRRDGEEGRLRARDLGPTIAAVRISSVFAGVTMTCGGGVMIGRGLGESGDLGRGRAERGQDEARAALQLPRDDAGAERAADDDRLGQRVGGGGRLARPPDVRDHLARLEGHGPRGVADLGDDPGWAST